MGLEDEVAEVVAQTLHAIPAFPVDIHQARMMCDY